MIVIFLTKDRIKFFTILIIFCSRVYDRSRTYESEIKKESLNYAFARRGSQFGAGGRTRTGTVSPPVDFESTTSANSITPANLTDLGIIQ